MSDTISAKELALLAGTDAKSMRRFIRAQAQTDAAVIGACGQGNRYEIDVTDAAALVEAFKAHGGRKAHAPSQSRSLDVLAALVFGTPDEDDADDEGAFDADA